MELHLTVSLATGRRYHAWPTQMNTPWQAGTSIFLPRRDGRLSWPKCLVIDGHPSKY